MRMLLLIFAVFCNFPFSSCPADLMTDRNATMRQAMQADRSESDPGWSSRAMTMVNGAIYDSLMAIEPTHQAFLVDATARQDTSKEAAAVQAAYQVLVTVYPRQASLFDTVRDSSLTLIPDGAKKSTGIDLGTEVANRYIAWKSGDRADSAVEYARSRV